MHKVVKSAISYHVGNKKSNRNSFMSLDALMKEAYTGYESEEEIKEMDSYFSPDKAASLLRTERSNLMTMDGEGIGWWRLVNGLVKNSSSFICVKDEYGISDIVKGTTNNGISYILNDLDGISGLIVSRNDVSSLLKHSI